MIPSIDGPRAVQAGGAGVSKVSYLLYIPQLPPAVMNLAIMNFWLRGTVPRSHASGFTAAILNAHSKN